MFIILDGLSKKAQTSAEDEKFLDGWVVHIDGDFEVAREYALRHNLVLVEQVSPNSITEFYFRYFFEKVTLI